jgi:hypothetical protein
MRYSIPANKSVEEIVHGVPPFPLVRESLAKGAEKARWSLSQPHRPRRSSASGPNMPDRVYDGCCRTEVGTKKEQIRLAISGRYDRKK